ncbi:MAG: pilin [Candidatus Saccharibacteria bacterium]|nr:pilin [Candidatus Saccharibacteria bacterium]
MKRILLAIITLSVIVPVYFGGVAHAELFEGAKGSACGGVALSADSTKCDPNAEKKANSLLATALNIFSIVVGIIAVVMIMVGGLKYITSGGDAAQTNTAKDTVMYAAIGLVIVAMSQVIVKFVLNRFTK